MKYRALTLGEHQTTAWALWRIYREAHRLEPTLPIIRDQKFANKIMASANKIRESMILRAYKEGLNGNDIYCSDKAEVKSDVQNLLDNAGLLLGEAVGAMQNSGKHVDERATRALAFWICRLMEDARRGASR